MSITLFIVLITAGISIAGFSNPNILQKNLFYPYRIKEKKEWFRFISHIFIHADWMHLIFNMIALYSFGRILEKSFFPALFEDKAPLYFMLLYFGGAIMSSLYDYEKNKHNTHYTALGASGAVSAIIFAFILIAPLSKGIRLMFLPIDLPAFVFGILYLAYEWYMGKKQMDNIGHSAHFWGAIFGFVFTGSLKTSLFLNFWHQVTGL